MTDADQGKRSAVSAASIVDAALSIIDRRGMDGLTMRRLGQELGVDPMTIYRHFPNKGAVLDGVMERIWLPSTSKPPPRDPPGRSSSPPSCTACARRCSLTLVRSRSLAPARPRDRLFLLMEKLIGVLVSAGMEIDDGSAELLNALVNYTVGHVLAESGDPVGGDADPHSNLLVSPLHFPNLAAVFNSGWQYDPHHQYDRALRSMIEGWPRTAPPSRSSQ